MARHRDYSSTQRLARRGRSLTRAVSSRPMLAWPLAVPALAVVLAVAGCGSTPYAKLGAGEPLPNHPMSLPWEGGLRPPDQRDAPAYLPFGSPVVRQLEDPWSPLALPVRPRRCYAVELILGDGGVGDTGPLSEATRRVKPDVVLKAPDGAILARADGNALAYCNGPGHAHLTIDLVASSRLPPTLGSGPLRARLHEREPTSDEAWELDARATPLFAGGGIALVPDVGDRVSRGTATRSLASFDPVALGAIEPSECVSVRATLAAGAAPTAGVTTFDAPLVYTHSAPAPGSLARRADELPAHELVAGRLVAQPICNDASTPLPTWLVAARRSNDLRLGTGEILLEIHTQPLVTGAGRRRFLDGDLRPSPAEPFTRRGPPETRRLEAFEPLPVSIAPGECISFELSLGTGAAVRASATNHSHLFVLDDSRSPDSTKLAVVPQNGAPIVRTACNLMHAPWTLTLALHARDGKPPGTGPLSIQIMTRAATPKD